MARASASIGHDAAAAASQPLLPPCEEDLRRLIPAEPPAGVVEPDRPPRIDSKHRTGVDGAALRKISTHVLLPACLVVFLVQVDRVYVALSAPQLLADMGWSQGVYARGVSAFFLGYVTFQIPTTMLMQRLGTPACMGASLVVWSLAAAGAAFARSPTQYFALRFFLGVAESGTFPGVWAYLGLFLPGSRITLAMAAVDVTMMASQVLSPLAGTSLMGLDGTLGLAGWQWLCLAAALPALALGAWFLFRMPKGPATARFLTAEEADWVEDEVGGAAGSDPAVPAFEQLYSALMNPRLWGCALIYLMRLMAMYVMLFWSVLLITAMLAGPGLHPPPCRTHAPHPACRDPAAILLATIPYGGAAAATLFNGWHSQVSGERRLHVAIPFVAGGLVFVWLPILSDVHVALGISALTLGAAGAVCGGSVLTAMASGSLSRETKAFGLGLYNSVANLGGVIGPLVTGALVGSSGSYGGAVVAMAGVLVLGGLLAAFLREPSDHAFLRRGAAKAAAEGGEAEREALGV